MPGIDPFAGQVGACDAGLSRLQWRGLDCAWPSLRGIDDRRLRRRPAGHRGFPRDPPALVGGHRSLVAVEVSLRCPGNEASMPARHAMQATGEATRFGDREYPCRSPKRAGPIRLVGRPDLPSMEGWCSLSRPVTCQAWRDDLPRVEDDPSSTGRSTFHAWRIDLPRDDQRASPSGRST